MDLKRESEKTCEILKDSIDDDSKFKILLSPLINDPDGKHTSRVFAAFGGEVRRFRVFQICESLKLDYRPGSDLQTQEEKVLQRGRDLIKSMHADLLLFGNVEDQEHYLRIYAINEHGGCEFKPKETIFLDDPILEKFSEKEKENLIDVSLKEMSSACLNQSTTDWPLFAKKMEKMESFLRELPTESNNDLVSLATDYLIAASLLDSHGQGDVWFTRGQQFLQKK